MAIIKQRFPVKRMLINAIDPEESRIAVVEDGVLQELHVELANREAYLGNIYKGKVVNIEPSIGAAFVAFGGRVNGFLHVSDVLPAYGRDEFRLEDVIEGRARVDVDDGPESMQQALSDDDDDEDDDNSVDEIAAAPRQPSKRGSRRRKGAQGASDEGAAEGEDASSGLVDADEGIADEDLEEQEPAIEAVENVDVGLEIVTYAEHDHDDAVANEEHEGDAAQPDSADAAQGGDVADDDTADDDAADDDADGDDDDGDDDDHHGFGFGQGLTERPLAMAAADPDDQAAGAHDGDRGASVEAQPATTSKDHAPKDADPHAAASQQAPSNSAPAGSADEEAAHAAPDGADGREVGEGASPRRKRSRRSRSRKSAERTGGDAPADAASAEGDAVTTEAREQPGRKKRPRRGAGRESNTTHDRRALRGNRPTIDQLLRKGQELVVQITKEGIGNKGPTLTTYVSLPGRCLVLMPSLPKCGVSRKIEDGRERRRLKRVVKELDLTGSGGIGFIVRTAGINKSLEDVQRDRDYLNKIWEMVAQRLKVTKAPALLYQESDLVLKAMRDQFTPDIADVVVDSEDVYMRIRDFAEKLMPVMADRIKRHSVTTPLFHSFGIEKDVEELYEPQVELSNGGSIVIDQAEALVAIDVNSGKYKAGGQSSDETAYRTNLESIPEIVRQLRLRDLGGLIIIDFIDMLHEKHRRSVERKIIDALRGDRARIKVGRISPFGMMEITRQRVGPGLKRTVFMQCPHCKGAGWSRTVQSKALSVLREARALVNLKGYSMLQVFVAPAVSDYLVNYKRRSVLELEDAVGKSIVFRPETSYPIDVVHYRFMTGDGQEARVAIPAGLGVKV